MLRFLITNNWVLNDINTFIAGLFVIEWDMNVYLLNLKASKSSHNNYEMRAALSDGINENCDR